MADLLTHVLVAYSVGVVLSWRYQWIKKHHITLLMIGATLPDLTRIGLIVEPAYIHGLGLPFNYFPLHTIIGSLIIAFIITQFVNDGLAFPIIGVGALSHHLLDSLLLNASGYSYPMFWPVSSYSPPSPGLYLSTDMWPALVAGTISLAIWMIDRKKLKSELTLGE